MLRRIATIGLPMRYLARILRNTTYPANYPLQAIAVFLPHGKLSRQRRRHRTPPLQLQGNPKPPKLDLDGCLFLVYPRLRP